MPENVNQARGMKMVDFIDQTTRRTVMKKGIFVVLIIFISFSAGIHSRTAGEAAAR